MAESLLSSARSLRPDPAGGGSTTRQRGFTLAEVLVVLLIIGVVVVIALPNLARARVRSILLSQMKQVRQASMVTRMDAIRGGRQTVLGFTTELGRPALIAWRDDDGDEVRDAGERIIGRWTFSERVTVANDTAVPLRLLTGAGIERGVVFFGNGTALSAFAGGSTGSGAFRVTDVLDNRFQVEIQGGSGTVTEHMWDGSTWSDRFVHWRY